MSRIIQSIINNAFENDPKNLILLTNPNKLNKKFLSFKEIQLFSFEKNPLDTLDKILLINSNDLNQSIASLPHAVISTWIPHYNNAKNLSSTFKIPLINIFEEDSLIVKKENIFELSKNHLHEDINLVNNSDLAKQFFIKNFEIIEENLEKQIIKLVKQWILK